MNLILEASVCLLFVFELCVATTNWSQSPADWKRLLQCRLYLLSCELIENSVTENSSCSLVRILVSKVN